MIPDERELDEEIRGHLALAIKERIDAGEDPESARLHASFVAAWTVATSDPCTATSAVIL